MRNSSIICILLNCFYFISAGTVSRSDEKDYNIIVVQSKNMSSVLIKSKTNFNGYPHYKSFVTHRGLQYGGLWWPYGIEPPRGDDIIRPWKVYVGLNYNTTSEKWESPFYPLISKIVKEGPNVTLEIYDWQKDKWVNRSEIKSSNVNLDEIPCKYGMTNLSKIDNSGVYNSDTNTWMRPVPCFEEGLFDWNTGITLPFPITSVSRINRMMERIALILFVSVYVFMFAAMLIILVGYCCCNMCRRSRG